MEHIFSIIQPKSGAYIFPIILLIIILFFTVVILLSLILGMKSTRLIITDTNLIIKSPLFGKTIPLENIEKERIKSINLEEENGYQLGMRRYGNNLPGFKSGWYNLRNGEKALVFITDRTNVLLIPTREYPVLFSTNDAAGIMELLK